MSGQRAADARTAIARRAAQDLPEGAYVNLGIGLPTLVADHRPPGREIIFHSENGLLGMGPAPLPDQLDPELINAGKAPVTLLPGAAIFHHNDAFMMMRGGHLDYALLGAYQVAGNGDLANWITDSDARAPAVGGAMDLAVGARQVWALMEHTTRDGKPRILERCTYPLTAAGVGNAHLHRARGHRRAAWPAGARISRRRELRPRAVPHRRHASTRLNPVGTGRDP